MNSHELREAAFEADICAKTALVLKEAGGRSGYGKYGERVLTSLINDLYEGEYMDTPAGVILRNHIKQAMMIILEDSLSRLRDKGVEYTPNNPFENLQYGYEDEESVVDEEVPVNYKRELGINSDTLHNRIYAAQDARKERRKENIPHSQE